MRVTAEYASGPRLTLPRRADIAMCIPVPASDLTCCVPLGHRPLPPRAEQPYTRTSQQRRAWAVHQHAPDVLTIISASPLTPGTAAAATPHRPAAAPAARRLPRRRPRLPQPCREWRGLRGRGSTYNRIVNASGLENMQDLAAGGSGLGSCLHLAATRSEQQGHPERCTGRRAEGAIGSGMVQKATGA